MTHFEVRGLVIRAVEINESDRLITIYSDSMGVLTALAKGARSLKSRKMAATVQFCYSDFVLFSKGDKLYVKEVSLIESFFDLRKSIEGLALAAYILDVLCEVATAEADPELLRLALNSLYAISKGRYPLWLVKAAFEIRCASILGFMPDLFACHSCGSKDGDFYFDIMAGAVQCFNCHSEYADNCEYMTDEHESHIICILTPGARVALEYCIFSPIEKLFSFTLGADERGFFTNAAEKYLLNHIERGFKTLDFYNEVKG